MREQLSRTSWQGDGAGLVNEWHLFLNPVMSVAGNARCRTTFTASSSCWPSTASKTVLFTSATA
jgi:hypothetical protein